jgi:hypothetical protein
MVPASSLFSLNTHLRVIIVQIRNAYKKDLGLWQATARATRVFSPPLPFHDRSNLFPDDFPTL